MHDAIYIFFVFALGSCVGSFLNVVVWRLPRVELNESDGLFTGLMRSWQALSWPPSHCPKCGKTLKWYDNLPVVGWIKLRGRCRFCGEPISMRYPIVEAICGLLFVIYYVMFFVVGIGPCVTHAGGDGVARFHSVPLDITVHWPIYAIDMVLIAGLLAATLIDAELYIIPVEIPWFIVPFALIEHAVFDRPGWPGALNLSAPAAALAAGGGVGFAVSFVLWWVGMIPTAFSDGGPLLEIDKKRAESKGELPDPEREYTPSETRAELRKEMLFLLAPMALGLMSAALVWKLPGVRGWADANLTGGWVGGLLGSVLGLLVGAAVVWLFRIFGSYAFGREAMGLGDVHLMAAVGAVLGAGPATIAFFIAPFFSVLYVIYVLFWRKGRELPLGPYLSLASAFVMLFYCPIADYLSPGITGLLYMLSGSMGG